MKNSRTALCGLMGILCVGILQGCGGGYHAGSASMTPVSISISVNPTSVVAGHPSTLMWSATGGSCTASGAWSGTEPASGTMTVTGTSAGSETFTLTCSGGIYSSNSASATLTVTAASAATVTPLVSDVAGGMAAHVDTHLVNPWGVSIPAAPSTAPSWVANNGTQTSTLYDGNGVPQPAATPLIVNLAPSAGGAAFGPTGIVANSSSTDFVVSAAGKSGSSAFIFDGVGGMIAGWSLSVDLTHAVTMYTDAGGAVYKGLAIAPNNGALFLYATDFHNNKIDVFNTSFVKQAPSATAFTFADPSLPAGYAPFGIQAIPGTGVAGATQIYVTYAQQAADNTATTNGPGLGYVDIYDTNGKLIKQLIAAGVLNAPWGIALAPADFGTFSGALLVGNFGDGMINAFDPAAGTPLGLLANTNGGTAAAPGLLGIAFGNDGNSQPHNTLYFASGVNGGADGVYGRIELTSP